MGIPRCLLEGCADAPADGPGARQRCGGTASLELTWLTLVFGLARVNMCSLAAYGPTGPSGLQNGKPARRWSVCSCSDAQRLKPLEAENGELKRPMANSVLEVDAKCSRCSKENSGRGGRRRGRAATAGVGADRTPGTEADGHKTQHPVLPPLQRRQRSPITAPEAAPGRRGIEKRTLDGPSKSFAGSMAQPG